MKAVVAENADFAGLAESEKKSKGPKRLVEAMIGGHAPFTLGDDALGALAEVVTKSGRGFHVHACEDAFDTAHSHSVYGKDPLRRLDESGLLSEKSLVAHGVSLTAEDREI